MSTKYVALVSMMFLFTSGVVNAEVVFGGYSFNDPTPKAPANALSITETKVINLTLNQKATTEEKKHFDNAVFFANMIKPSAILLYKNVNSVSECEKGMNDFSAYLQSRFSSKGYKREPIMRGGFAATFDPDYVKFAKFKDGKKTYNVTTGCKQKEGVVTIFSQIDFM